MYTDHVIEVYRVDSSILETSLSSLILNNTSFLFCPNSKILVVIISDIVYTWGWKFTKLVRVQQVCKKIWLFIIFS